MSISRERLIREAAASGFRPEIFEKAVRLLDLLSALRSHPFLKDRIALKGGPALNLFHFDVPRLSVDIDLNYIGSADREVMLEERPKIEQATMAACEREKIHVRKQPDEHAGGKWLLRYESAQGGGGNLELDFNFLLRVPLWDIAVMDSKKIGASVAESIPVLDIHELAAGKLCAVLARNAARDLFDAHHLLTTCDLDMARLKIGLVVYGCMSRRDWRTVKLDEVVFDPAEIESSLLPLLRIPRGTEQPRALNWSEQIQVECRTALEPLLSFSDEEVEFMNRLLDHGEIEPDLITGDNELSARILAHPGLKWKAMNVRKHRDLNP
jgi:hypothetical protein